MNRQGYDNPLTKLGYREPPARGHDGDCDHEWYRVRADYVNRRGEVVDKYECLYCPATRVEERPSARMTGEADRAGALGR